MRSSSSHSAHRAVRSLGQNFLTDKHSVERIINACHLSKGENILEIGPGQGALTHYLAQSECKIFAVEKDRRLAQQLESEFVGNDIKIISGDILKFDFDQLPHPIKVIGNIPYNISTPIIEKIIANKHRISEAFLTVQLEFGQRMTAKPHSKAYGSLTLFVQYHFDAKILFKIKAGSFSPKPKVDSCFVSLKPVERKSAVSEKRLFTLIQTSFQQRRKTIINSMKNLIPPDKLSSLLDKLKLSHNLRAENLDLGQFMAIAEFWEKEEGG